MTAGKFQSFIAGKCPRCRLAAMYEGSMYGFKKQYMHPVCPTCTLKFEIEPGYFYAAMYVSYAFCVAQVVALAVATAFLTGSESPWVYLVVLFAVIVGFAPLNYRYSRLVLLYYMTPKITYNPVYAERQKKPSA